MTCKVPSSLRTSSMVMNIGLNRTWECFSARAFNQYFSKNAFSSDVQLVKQVWKLGGPSEVVNRMCKFSRLKRIYYWGKQSAKTANDEDASTGEMTIKGRRWHVKKFCFIGVHWRDLKNTEYYQVSILDGFRFMH